MAGDIFKDFPEEGVPDDPAAEIGDDGGDKKEDGGDEDKDKKLDPFANTDLDD